MFDPLQCWVVVTVSPNLCLHSHTGDELQQNSVGFDTPQLRLRLGPVLRPVDLLYSQASTELYSTDTVHKIYN